MHVANTFVRSTLRSRPFWGLLGERVWRVYGQNVAYTSQSPLVLAQIFESDRVATIRRLPLLGEWIDRQRATADYYLRTLTVEPDMLCVERPRAFYNRLQFPLLLRTPDECGRMVARLRESGISTARPYREIAAIAAHHYGYTGDCPQAERIASCVMVVPCSHALTPADVERVASAVNGAWSTIGAGSPRRVAAFHAPRETSSS
jgi:dTDP-4-amino-4,6-dideoxygalactose transaminase